VVKQFDNRGRKINYDAPGQIGAHSVKPQKLPHVDRFLQQLDRLVEYHDRRGDQVKPLHVTLEQMRQLMKVPKETVNWYPKGDEEYRGHPLRVVEEEE
jgi:hypothetical protein